jgi:hypothetical protein
MQLFALIIFALFLRADIKYQMNCLAKYMVRKLHLQGQDRIYCQASERIEIRET